MAGIQRVAPSSVKRVILTGSFAAVGAWGLRDERNKVYTVSQIPNTRIPCLMSLDLSIPLLSTIAELTPAPAPQEEDWFPATNEDVEKNTTNKNFLYLASKLFAERAAWEAQKGPDVAWDLVAINPVIVYGPLLQRIQSLDHVNESMGVIWNKFLNGKTPEDEVPADGVPLYVDVRVSLTVLIILFAPQSLTLMCIGRRGRTHPGAR